MSIGFTRIRTTAPLSATDLHSNVNTSPHISLCLRIWYIRRIPSIELGVVFLDLVSHTITGKVAQKCVHHTKSCRVNASDSYWGRGSIRQCGSPATEPETLQNLSSIIHPSVTTQSIALPLVVSFVQFASGYVYVCATDNKERTLISSKRALLLVARFPFNTPACAKAQDPVQVLRTNLAPGTCFFRNSNKLG